MSSSSLSSLLSSPPPDDSEDEPSLLGSNRNTSHNSTREPSPELEDLASNIQTQKKRRTVITRELLLEDNPDFAFVIAFQSRFSSLFRNTQIGPQELEDGLKTTPLSEQVELLLCKLLTLVLNRKKNVERGHYGRALEEAITTHWKEGSESWNGENPLQGGRTFLDMAVLERLIMMRTLVLWCLRHSEAIQLILKDNYKLNRKEDDRNVSIAVLPWGTDREKKKYYLIEGKDDTTFRVYQEYISPGAQKSTWFSVAGTIDELRDFTAILEEDGSKNAKEFRAKILAEIPRFEEGENKRKRREYRQQRRAYFEAAAVGPSVYEGRTRGKRIRYNFDSDEDGGYNTGSGTRSSRRVSPSNQGPYTTASGRQSRRPGASALGDNLFSANGTGTPYTASDSGASGRATRNSTHRQTEMDLDDPDDQQMAHSSESEQNESDQNYDARDPSSDDNNESAGSFSESEHESPRSLKLILKFKDPSLLREVQVEDNHRKRSRAETDDSIDSAHVVNGMSQASIHDRNDISNTHPDISHNDQKDATGDTSMIINGSDIQ